MEVCSSCQCDSHHQCTRASNLYSEPAFCALRDDPGLGTFSECAACDGASGVSCSVNTSVDGACTACGYGCVEQAAINFDPSARYGDQSCVFPPPPPPSPRTDSADSWSDAQYIIITALASLAATGAIILAILIAMLRHHPYMKAANVTFSFCTLSAIFVIACSDLFMYLGSSLCRARLWMQMVAAFVVVGTGIAKAYQVHRLYQDPIGVRNNPRLLRQVNTAVLGRRMAAATLVVTLPGLIPLQMLSGHWVTIADCHFHRVTLWWLLAEFAILCGGLGVWCWLLLRMRHLPAPFDEANRTLAALAAFGFGLLVLMLLIVLSMSLGPAGHGVHGITNSAVLFLVRVLVQLLGVIILAIVLWPRVLGALWQQRQKPLLLRDPQAELREHRSTAGSSPWSKSKSDLSSNVSQSNSSGDLSSNVSHSSDEDRHACQRALLQEHLRALEQATQDRRMKVQELARLDHKLTELRGHILCLGNELAWEEHPKLLAPRANSSGSLRDSSSDYRL